jgi:hypothetical protein
MEDERDAVLTILKRVHGIQLAVVKSDLAGQNMVQSNCSVCQEDFKRGSIVASTMCNHVRIPS